MKPVKFLIIILLSCSLRGDTFGESQQTKSLEPVLDEDAQINVIPGFDAELLYTVDKDKYGSWISMTMDDQNRLIVSDQKSAGVFRITPPEKGQPLTNDAIEKLPLEGPVYGFLFAHGYLYMVNAGLHRAKVLPDGKFGKPEKIAELGRNSEHGAHSLVETEDGKGIYLLAGNATEVPAHQKSRIRKNMRNDVLLKHYTYGHSAGKKAPAGFVMRLSPDGKEREMMSMGYRNPVDFGLNRHGEMFVYDADMEYDIGSPWYRPTRINHAVSGGENGWRATSMKWRKYFPDSIGSVIDIGPGSPTGVVFGTNARFPTEYRDAMFICDWTFATMYSIHLTPKGSSYVAEKREFLSKSSGLAMSDVQVGKDGNMYFITGGRNEQSYLYRISYTGSESTELSKLDRSGKEERATRHLLEAFHGKESAEAVEVAWPFLSSDDYHLRYAARLALESQDPSTWAEKAYHETNDLAAIHALLGLARCDVDGSLPVIIERLNEVDFAHLDKMGKLALLRTYSVAMSRHGMPSADLREAAADKLDSYFPSDDDNLNEELCRLLSYLEHPSIVRKTVALMKETEVSEAEVDVSLVSRHDYYRKRILEWKNNTPNTLNMHYLFCLKDVEVGWTEADRRFCLTWVNTLLEKKGGTMYSSFLVKIRETFIESIPDAEKPRFQELLGEVKGLDLSKLAKAEGPPVDWTVDSAFKAIKDKPLRNQDFIQGEKMYEAGMCVVCHRLGEKGNHFGPDLTNLGKRSDYRSILESILNPSLVVSSEYAQDHYVLKNGTSVFGRVADAKEGKIFLVTSGFAQDTLSMIRTDEIESKTPSPVSMMPAALINSMNEEEVRNLMAYLISGGDREHEVFKE